MRLRSRLTGRSPGLEETPRRVLGEGELPSVAVITMARDEGPLLRRWVDHHSAQVGAENVLVVDDQSRDGSTDDLPCSVIRLPGPSRNDFEVSRMRIMGGLSAALLEAHDAVLFCDADEFVVADPERYATLRHFVADRPGHQALGVLGLNVVHDLQREGPLLDTEPILAQRRYATFVPLMCKPALKWVPASWMHASHGIGCPFTVDPDLYMFHMKFADRDHLAAAAARRHQGHLDDGRAAGTSWVRPPDELVALLDEVGSGIDPDTVAPFRPRKEKLGRIVKRRPPMWKATGHGQLAAMQARPVVRIPRRFRELL